MRFVLTLFMVLFLSGCQASEESTLLEINKQLSSITTALEELNKNIEKEYEVFTNLKTHYDFKDVFIFDETYENIDELDAFILAMNKGHSASININLVNQNKVITLSYLDKVITYEKREIINGEEHLVVTTCDSFDKIETDELTTYVIISNGLIDQQISIDKSTRIT